MVSLQKKIIIMENNQHISTMRAVFAIAPMIDVTYAHFRYFMRLITKKATVYTEMIHHDAVINNHTHLLPFNQIQHPIVLQLGGSDPQKLAEAALIGQKYGYDQINLNVGCPSPRVQKGSFGACLMKQPELVKECMKVMAKAVKIKCTVKCRLGVDDFDSYEFLKDFVTEVSEGGKGLINKFVIHARIAKLKGLTPTQNRTIPPLIYDRVYRLKQDFPNIEFQLNGGLKNVKQAYQLVQENKLDGCMVGRLAYQNPFQLMTVDETFYGETNYRNLYESDAAARKQIMLRYSQYVQKLERGEIRDEFGNLIKKPNNSFLIKPILNFYAGLPWCGKYRQYLSDFVKNRDCGPLYLAIRKAAEQMAEGRFRDQKYSQKQQKQDNKVVSMKQAANYLQQQKPEIQQIEVTEKIQGI